MCGTTEMATACPAAENTLRTLQQRVSAAGRWIVLERLLSVRLVATPRSRVTRTSTIHHGAETT